MVCAEPVTKFLPVYVLGCQVPVKTFQIGRIRCKVFESPAVGYVVIGNDLDARGLDRKDFLVRAEHGWYTLRDYAGCVPETMYRALHFHHIDDVEEYMREALAWGTLGD